MLIVEQLMLTVEKRIFVIKNVFHQWKAEFVRRTMLTLR